MTSLLNPSRAKTEQIPDLRKLSDGNGDFETSGHIYEGEAYTEGWQASLDPRVSTHISLKKSPRDSISDTTTQYCSERWWLQRPNCRPRPAEKGQIKSELAVNNHYSVDESLSSPILGKRGHPCDKKWWPRNNGCQPVHGDTPKLKPVLAPDHSVLRRNISVLDSINNAKCGEKKDKDKEDCEEKNRIGFWVLCSLLTVVGICGLLLILLVLLTRARRKRPSPFLMNTRPEHKSGMSTPAPSVSEVQFPRVRNSAACSMRRVDEDENDETGSVRRYTTLDGATDGWTKWIHQKQKRGGMVSIDDTFHVYHQ